PVFASRDTVLSRPDGDPATRLTVCPGEHAATWQGNPYSVVWWSPRPEALRRGVEAPFGLRRDDLIVKTVEPAVLRRYQHEYQAWKTTRQQAIDEARKPSMEVMTATEAAAIEGRSLA